MNQVIIDQLKKVKVADLPKWEEDDLHLVIPKKAGLINKIDFVENQEYIIQLEKYLIEPFEGFTLHDNWNKGTHPNHLFLKVKVNQIMGKMINLSTIAYDFKTKQLINETWNGWLPRKGIKIIESL